MNASSKPGLRGGVSVVRYDPIQSYTGADIPPQGTAEYDARCRGRANRINFEEDARQLAKEQRFSRSPAPEPYDFGPLTAGEVSKEPGDYLGRTDGEFLLYTGKDHAIYGPTESGKDMFFIAAVKDILGIGDDYRVGWIDFEEANGIETGSRLLNAGVGPELITDPRRFRYYTPTTAEEAIAARNFLVTWKPAFVFLAGVTAAYQLFGWKVKEGDNAADYRREIVRPFLDAGAGTLSADHVPASAEGELLRNPYGGVMKLNVSDGASYLLVPEEQIGIEMEGASRLYITKDRPGMVKKKCDRVKGHPLIRFAGVLTVKSSGLDSGELDISVVSPIEAEEKTLRPGSAEVPDWLMEKVISGFKDYGSEGCAKTSYRDAFEGKGKSKVPLAIDKAVAFGCLVDGESSTRGKKLAWAKDWDSAEKIKV